MRGLPSVAECLVAGGLGVATCVAVAHSEVEGFSGQAELHSAHVNKAMTSGPLYPAMVVLDTRHITIVTIKINAKVVRMRPLYVGKLVDEGEVLAELESAELATVQDTYLSILNNIDAVKAFSVAVPQKLVEARMTLQWRGMSQADIEKLEATRQPIERIAIRAPAKGYLYTLNMSNGQILNAGVQAGMFAAAGTPVASVAQLNSIVVEAAVPVSIARSLRVGQLASVRIPNALGSWQLVPATVQAPPGLPIASNQRQVVRLALRGAPKNLTYVNGLQVTVAFKGERDAKQSTAIH
jgi:predicted RecB family endonuclease